jgi:dihydrolipoamide dehydrogenase
MSDLEYDVIVIGSGPGGYVCAIRCAQLGFKTACIEKDKTLGGTCLNVGCIPSKALLQTSERYHEADHSYKKMGISIEGLQLDLKKMMAFKNQVVTANVKGVEYLFKKNKIDRITGHGVIVSPNSIQVDDQIYKAKNIIIATGSEVMSLPGIDVDEKSIVSSTGALSFDTVPKSLAVIGGGYIGLEMGSVWSRLGAEVTVIEYLDKILPGMDQEISKEMSKILKRQGIKFILETKVTKAKVTKKGVSLSYEPSSGGDEQSLDVEKVLVSTGRKPYTHNLGLEDLGVNCDERGRVIVNSQFATNVEGIYAIGDVIAGPMLAHKAEDEGVILAEILAGQSGHIDYNLIPGVVYTHPEAAQVGKTEQELKSEGVEYKVGKFPFTANGRARAMNSTDGFVKILAHASTDRILGVHIIGPEAGTLISEAVLAMEFGASSEDLARTCHAHPTLEEAVKEAALDVDGRAIHI